MTIPKKILAQQIKSGLSNSSLLDNKDGCQSDNLSADENVSNEINRVG